MGCEKRVFRHNQMLSNGRRGGMRQRCFLGILGGAAAGGAAARNTRAVDRADTSDRRADGIADNDQEAQARVATFRDVQSLDGLKAATFGSTRVGLRLMQSTGRGEKKWRYL